MITAAVIYADLVDAHHGEEFLRALSGDDPMTAYELRSRAAEMRTERTVWTVSPELDEALRLYVDDLEFWAAWQDLQAQSFDLRDALDDDEDEPEMAMA